MRIQENYIAKFFSMFAWKHTPIAVKHRQQELLPGRQGRSVEAPIEPGNRIQNRQT